MSSRSIITYRNFDGSSELTSIWDVFSGSQVARGDTSPTNTFRIYNNYLAEADIVDAIEMQIVISTNDQFIVYDQRTSYTDFTRDLINGGYIEIRCTYSGESGASRADAFVPFSGAFSGSEFDRIPASGSDNYNEYEMRMNIPASGTGGSWNTSGSAAPTIFAKWNNEGIDPL